MLKKVMDFCEEHGLLAHGSSIVVAVSGGVDSMALLVLLLRLRDRRALSVHVAHFEHGIRGAASCEDAQHVAAFCRARGIACTIEAADVPRYARERKLSLETAARELRYAFLRRVKASVGAEAIAVAHHADDQAETVVHHLIRGSGFSGLSAMRKEEGLYIRPLLCLRKKEIKERLSELSLSYVEDSTNEDFSYTRNFIRKKIIPLMELVNSRAVEHLFGEAELMAEVEEYFFRKAEAFIEAHGRKAEAEISFSLKPLKKEDALVRREIYRLALRILEGNIINLSKAHLYALDSLIFSGNGKRTELPGGYLGLIKEKKLYFIKAE